VIIVAQTDWYAVNTALTVLMANVQKFKSSHVQTFIRSADLPSVEHSALRAIVQARIHTIIRWPHPPLTALL
jgi:hypothetical protein